MYWSINIWYNCVCIGWGCTCCWYCYMMTILEMVDRQHIEMADYAHKSCIHSPSMIPMIQLARMCQRIVIKVGIPIGIGSISIYAYCIAHNYQHIYHAHILSKSIHQHIVLIAIAVYILMRINCTYSNQNMLYNCLYCIIYQQVVIYTMSLTMRALSAMHISHIYQLICIAGSSLCHRHIHYCIIYNQTGIMYMYTCFYIWYNVISMHNTTMFYHTRNYYQPIYSHHCILYMLGCYGSMHNLAYCMAVIHNTTNYMNTIIIIICIYNMDEQISAVSPLSIKYIIANTNNQTYSILQHIYHSLPYPEQDPYNIDLYWDLPHNYQRIPYTSYMHMKHTCHQNY